MKRKYIINIAVIIVFCAYALLAWGYAGGITGHTKKNGNNSGCWCHNGAPSNNVIVDIMGPDTVRVNETVNYNIRISGGPLTRGGTDIAVSLGQLILINGSGLRENEGELTHVFPKAQNEGSVTFVFSYKAPPFVCVDTIFANGNSVNFDLDPNGDQWNYAEKKNCCSKSDWHN